MLFTLLMPAVVSSLFASSTCGDLPGAASLVSRDRLNYLLVGEYHGTVEMPRVAADLLCAAVQQKRPVVLGLEFTAENQTALEAYVQSDGSVAARERVLAAPAWQQPDGRNSLAVFELLETARSLRAAGHIVRVVAFDLVPAPAVSRARETALAEALVAARARVPNSLVIALTGAGHAGKTPWSSQNPPFPSTGQLLPEGETIALTFARPGGRYFGCRAATAEAPGGCAVYDMPAREPVRPRGIEMDASLREGFEGVYSAGGPYTAARPART
jgi:hypothetical protein